MNKKRFAVLLFVCALAGIVLVAPVLASHGYRLSDLSCDPDTNTITMEGTASRYPASGYWIYVYADGVRLGMYSRPDYRVPNGPVTDTFTNPAISYDVTVNVVASGGPVNDSVVCDSLAIAPVIVPVIAPEPVVPPRCPIFHDGRINSCDTFSPVVLYGFADANDNWGLDIYAADGSGRVISISPDVFTSVADCPTENTLVFSDGASGISLYRLAENADGSCPYQLNAPATEAGKTYIVIFDGLFANGYYESFEE